MTGNTISKERSDGDIRRLATSLLKGYSSG